MRPSPRSRLVRLLVRGLRWYQRVLSPLKRAPSCRYLPTCSQYAVEAVQNRGALEGVLWAVWRVLRCNPLFHSGYHPAPEARCTHHQESAMRPFEWKNKANG